MLAWVFLVEPYARDASLPLAERPLSPAYPLADLLLFTLLMRLLFTPGTRAAAFWLLAAGIVCNIAPDTAFAVLELPSLSGDVALLDAAWLVGYLCLGAAALHPSMVSLGETAPRHEAGLTRLRLAALGVAALTGPAVLAVEASPVPTLRGDPARLGQLLDNLVSNAVKFTPPGGRVVVAFGASGDDVVLAGSDTGIGVPAAEQSWLFDRFFRASSAQERTIEGTGLGLTIARAIVEAHGGSIDFTSVEGEGTTVRVRLPLAGPQAAGAVPGEARTKSLV